MSEVLYRHKLSTQYKVKIIFEDEKTVLFEYINTDNRNASTKESFHKSWEIEPPEPRKAQSRWTYVFESTHTHLKKSSVNIYPETFYSEGGARDHCASRGRTLLDVIEIKWEEKL